MAANSSQLLMGLPSAGKTTFLAALWYVVQDPSSKSLLKLDHVVGDTKRLNELRDFWLKCEAVPRTSLIMETTLSLHLKDRVSGEPVILEVPDLAGETFDLQWADRQCSVTYDKMVQSAAGALFFINPAKIQEPTRLDMVEAVAEDFDENPPVDAPTQSNDPGHTWDRRSTPTQVKVVELLQFLLHRCPAPRPLRVALIVSAWDVVQTGPATTPAKWLAKQLPLLSQFIQGNPTKLDCRIYGLSAQGGPYRAAGEEDPLSNIDPLNRILLTGDTVAQKHDLTEPIKWLMS
jgi:hypothetical protein